MNKYDVAGLLKTYAEQVSMNGNSTEKLRNIVRELKDELDLRRLRQPTDEEEGTADDFRENKTSENAQIVQGVHICKAR